MLSWNQLNERQQTLAIDVYLDSHDDISNISSCMFKVVHDDYNETVIIIE